MTDPSTFYAIDLDHTLFDTTKYQTDYVEVAPENRPSDLSYLIYQDGKELLAALTERQVPFGIITFGDPDQQLLKIQLTGLSAIPFMIAPAPEKAAAMQAWHQTDGFHLPAVFANQVSIVHDIILVDDKAAAFIDTPEGVHGFLYRPVGRPVYEFQAGDVPSSVRTITSLLDIL